MIKQWKVFRLKIEILNTATEKHSNNNKANEAHYGSRYIVYKIEKKYLMKNKYKWTNQCPISSLLNVSDSAMKINATATN